jgi:hypothetical protein
MRFETVKGAIGKSYLISAGAALIRSRRWLKPLDLRDQVSASRFVHQLHVSESWWLRTLSSIDFSVRKNLYQSVEAAGIAAFAQRRLRAWEVKGDSFLGNLPQSCRVKRTGITYAVVPYEMAAIRYSAHVDVHSDPAFVTRLLEQGLDTRQLRQFYFDLGAPYADDTAAHRLLDDLFDSLRAGEFQLIRLPAQKSVLPGDSSSFSMYAAPPRQVSLGPHEIPGYHGIQSHTPQKGGTRQKARNLRDPAVRKALFAQYDIVIGPYKDLQKIEKEGYQREHFIPHSNFQTRSKQPDEKRSAVPIKPEFGTYSEADAITYFVYDDQSQGTEHRYLTDIEKEYASELEKMEQFATVSQWLDHMEAETARSLSMETIERAPKAYEARVPIDDAADVAKAIRIEYEEQLDRMGVDKNAPMANLVGGGSVLQPECDEVLHEF